MTSLWKYKMLPILQITRIPLNVKMVGQWQVANSVTANAYLFQIKVFWLEDLEFVYFFFFSEVRKKNQYICFRCASQKKLRKKWSCGWVIGRPKYISNSSFLVAFGLAAVCFSSNLENRFISFSVLIKKHTWLYIKT